MHSFTKEIIEQNQLELLYTTDDLYAAGINNELTQIKTYYEQKYTEKGLKITYLKFKLNQTLSFINPAEE